MKKSAFLTSAVIVAIIFFVFPSVAQTPDFDISKVNGVLSSKSNDVKTTVMWIMYIALLLGIGMLAASYLMQLQTAKAGFISLSIGIIFYIIFKAL